MWPARYALPLLLLSVKCSSGFGEAQAQEDAATGGCEAQSPFDEWAKALGKTYPRPGDSAAACEAFAANQVRVQDWSAAASQGGGKAASSAKNKHMACVARKAFDIYARIREQMDLSAEDFEAILRRFTSEACPEEEEEEVKKKAVEEGTCADAGCGSSGSGSSSGGGGNATEGATEDVVVEGSMADVVKGAMLVVVGVAVSRKLLLSSVVLFTAAYLVTVGVILKEAEFLEDAAASEIQGVIRARISLDATGDGLAT